MNLTFPVKDSLPGNESFLGASAGGSQVQPSSPLKGDQSVEGETCIANISPRERQRRLRMGIIEFVVAIVILAVLMGLGLSPLWRLPLFFLFAAATVGYFQWHDKTCVAHARLGTQKLTDKMEKVEDQAQLAQMRRQARKVMIKAMLVAIPLTLLAFLLP